MKYSKSINLIIPICLFLIMSGISLIIWENKNEYETNYFKKHTEISAEQIRIRMEGFLEVRLATLALLAKRWVEHHPVDFSQERFMRFAEAIYKLYPGYEQIAWIDPAGEICWIYPAEITRMLKGKNIYRDYDSTVIAIFEKAKISGNYQISPVIKSVKDHLSFAMWLPLIHENTIQGYLLGIFYIEHIMDICLAREINKEFIIRIYEDSRLIYPLEEKEVSDNPGGPGWINREIFFGKKAWRLEIKARDLPPCRASLSLNFSILLFGMVFSALLSILLYFLMQRMHLYRVARDQALYEISERKQVEKEREQLLSEISTKNEEMETFIYAVSHDLKTPVVTIDGFVNALREDCGGAIGEDGKHYLSRISEATRKMESLINDLLQLSRIGRIVEEKREISFADLAKEAIWEFRLHIEKRGIRINIADNMPPLFGERKRLTQVLNNLISNAVKYIGEDNPDPIIEVGTVKRDGKSIFFVRDNGIGIDPHFFDRIFQVFQRLREAKKIEGTGIGLTIVKRIIQKHGGEIWVESEKHRGSTFFFTLKEMEKNDGL